MIKIKPKIYSQEFKMRSKTNILNISEQIRDAQNKAMEFWRKFFLRDMTRYLLSLRPESIRCPQCEKDTNNTYCEVCRGTLRTAIPFSEIL